MKDIEKNIYVYADCYGQEPQLTGSLYVMEGKGKEVYAFEYNEKWLEQSKIGYIVDPDLNLYGGRQFVPVDKVMLGIFADSCPDRWGRLLMKRREAINARKEVRKPKKLTEIDYLLGVHDEARMGALRFKTVQEGAFLANDKELAAPPWTTLRSLEAASRGFEKDEGGLGEKWLNQLLVPGSSLGGARPKANIQAPDGSLWIAKFPSKHDENNSGGWEYTCHALAKLCGLNVPEARIENFSKLGSTFLIKRFDREGLKRIHFASAMTLLGKVDGASTTDGTGYLDLVAFVKANGAAPKTDLFELWRRMVFNIAVSNTDDHLRNHGFVITKNGWRLSPLYDVNPCIYGDSLALNITEDDSTMSFDLALQTAKLYNVDYKTAVVELKNIMEIVENNWESIAKKSGISRNGIEQMRPAFDMKYKR